MSDYNTTESVIYKIHCLDNSCDFVYFGSTINFKNRRALHKFDCNNSNRKNYNSKVYETIRANGGLENWIMEIVEVFPCESMRDLCIREQEYIDSAKNKMNSFRAFRTTEQRKVFDRERNRLYELTNKDKVRERKRLYYLANKDKIAEYHKKLRLANKERILEEKNKIESI